MNEAGATKCALEGIQVCEVRVGADKFINIRDETRTIDFPHLKGECCVCADNSGLKMKCGHYICPDDLLDHVWQQIKRLKYEINCATCTKIIEVDDIMIFGLPESDEKQYIYAALSINFCSSQDIQQCPSCKSYCQRKTTDNPQVICIVCSKNKSEPYLFCWYCLSQWNNPGNYKICGNKNCKKSKIEQLQNSPKIEFKDKAGKKVTVPIIRACPECFSVIQHNGGCNEMTCTICNFAFCFICLTPTQEGSLICKSTTWNPAATITCLPVPIQTNI